MMDEIQCVANQRGYHKHMSTAAEKTSWRWQLEQLQQQLGEWIEVKLRSDDRDLNLDIFPPWLGPLLVQIVWLLLAGLVLWIGYRIIYPYWQNWVRQKERSPSTLDSSPIKVYTVAELLAQSQKFQQDGDYTQASRWLYLAMLQRLNDANLIPHQFSRTDREYLQLLSDVPVVNVGEILVSLHEQLHFGDRQISSADFERCQQAYRQVDRELIIDN
ncbi:DUF4129 domain-containing protein [Chamaesiphon polymorphus]|uniref:Protein-glutamine gamma-glutamyltransferase-like C-terminal domain-containing protein n=1 Tax=Chamaesiphon polymorphus CCALA 037 TaxID=2107692 RepID=A0A2T1FV75_9CYAN|nr:DUF4129 domain-containing protein [Chamaesiphon polymorphus]PSB48836.1 hypothetical protein C7B77_23680 [Chamaesiphon polymorphus CCALA 037]